MEGCNICTSLKNARRVLQRGFREFRSLTHRDFFMWRRNGSARVTLTHSSLYMFLHRTLR